MAATIRLHQLDDLQPAAPRRLHDDGTYRRRRIVAVVVLAMSVVALVRIAASLAPSSEAAAVRTGTAISVVDGGTAAGSVAAAAAVDDLYVVQPGDTLWSIAAELTTDGDPRATVDRLVALNGKTPLDVGQRLRLR